MSIITFFSFVQLKSVIENMYKKPSSPLYANVSGSKYEHKDLTGQSEPTYYNTVTNKIAQPSRGVYSNINYQPKSSNIYSNVAEAREPTYKNAQYPLYDNLKSLGLLFNLYNIKCIFL